MGCPTPSLGALLPSCVLRFTVHERITTQVSVLNKSEIEAEHVSLSRRTRALPLVSYFKLQPITK